MSNKEDANLPLKTDSPSIQFFQTLILWSIKALALMMTIVILWSTLDVWILLFHKLTTPPYYILDLEDILGTFGAFLIVLIAIEIFVNIILYLRKDIIHLRLVISTALMAIARKVIILDYDVVNYSHLFGMAAIILSLGAAHWLVHRTNA